MVHGNTIFSRSCTCHPVIWRQRHLLMGDNDLGETYIMALCYLLMGQCPRWLFVLLLSVLYVTFWWRTSVLGGFVFYYDIWHYMPPSNGGLMSSVALLSAVLANSNESFMIMINDAWIVLKFLIWNICLWNGLTIFSSLCN